MVKKRAGKNAVESPAWSRKAGQAKPRQKAEPAAANTPVKQDAAPDTLLPGAWVTPGAVQVVGGVNDTTLLLSWLLNIRLASCGPALAFHRVVDGDVHIA